MLSEGTKTHKQLPSWLREGLEKIKQEKQKKIESTSSSNGNNASSIAAANQQLASKKVTEPPVNSTNGPTTKIVS